MVRRHLRALLNHCCVHPPSCRTPSSSGRIDLNSVFYFSPVPKPLSSRSLPQSHHLSIRPTSHHLHSLILLPICAYLSEPNVQRNYRKAVKAQSSGESPTRSTSRKLIVFTTERQRTTAVVQSPSGMRMRSATSSSTQSHLSPANELKRLQSSSTPIFSAGESTPSWLLGSEPLCKRYVGRVLCIQLADLQSLNTGGRPLPQNIVFEQPTIRL
jgi:hypothetical protein